MLALIHILILAFTKAYAAPLGIPSGIDNSMCGFRTGGPPGTGGVPIPGAMWLCIPMYIAAISKVVIAMAGSISLLMLIINGFRYMIGPVTEGSSDAAKKGITYALVGLGVALLAYVIVNTIVVAVTS